MVLTFSLDTAVTSRMIFVESEIIKTTKHSIKHTARRQLRIMDLSMLRSEYWDNISKASSAFWINVIRVHEVIFFLLILVILAPLLPSIDFGAKLAIPTVQNETYQTIGLNPLYGHPIQLKGHSCWPADLNQCLLDSSSQDPCCKELYDKDATVEQSVSDMALKLIVALLSIGYLVLRCLLWRAYMSRWEGLCTDQTGLGQQQQQQRQQRQQSTSVDTRFWLKFLYDSLVALAFSVIMTYIITDYVKEAVGSPRPNYYALQLFASEHSSDRSDLRGECAASIQHTAACTYNVDLI